MDKLIRLTPSQRKRCNRLIRKLCANYDEGNCLLLDDGETCVCPQTISFSLLCKWCAAEKHSGVVGTFRFQHYGKHLCSS